MQIFQVLQDRGGGLPDVYLKKHLISHQKLEKHHCFVTDEMLPEVQTKNTFDAIWKDLKYLHETLDKGQSFFLKNMLFSITISEGAYL